MFQSYFRGGGRPSGHCKGNTPSGRPAAGPWRRLFPIAVLLTMLLPSGPSFADLGQISIENLIAPDITVVNNGSTYTRVSGYDLSNIVADLRVYLDPGDVGRVKSFTAWIKARRVSPSTDYWADFEDYAYSQSYPAFNRPKTVDKVVTVQVPLAAYRDWAVGRCNVEAQYLRNTGLSDFQIFNADRVIGIQVHPALKYEMTGWDNIVDVPPEGGGAPLPEFNIICKKWDGIVAPLASDALDAGKPLVKAASLTIIEQYGPSGLCKLLLSGVVETHEPNMEVPLRLEDGHGKQTGVITVTTDHSKTAFFDYQETIKNNPDGPETGQVRIVGDNHDFQSAWAPYSMNCIEPGATALTAVLPPSVKLDVVAVDEGMVGEQVCPIKLKMVGLIEGHGAFEGNAVFLGPYYVSPPQSYQVVDGSYQFVTDFYDLNWAQGHANGELASPTAESGPMEQTVKFGFNINGDAVTESEPPSGPAKAQAPGVPLSDTVIASVPMTDFTFTCRPPSFAPNVQAGGGLAAETDNPFVPKGAEKAVAGQQQAQKSVPLKGQAQTLAAGQAQTATVGAAKTETVGTAKTETVGKAQGAALAPSGFSIVSPRGSLRDGVIRLQGGAGRNAKYALAFYGKNKSGRYVRSKNRALPRAMKGTTARFDSAALDSATQWRLEVCPKADKSKSACRRTDFTVPAKAKSAAPSLAPKQGTTQTESKQPRLQPRLTD